MASKKSAREHRHVHSSGASNIQFRRPDGPGKPVIFTTDVPSFRAKEVVSVLATWSEPLSGELLYPSRYRHSYLNGTRSGHFSRRILHRDETVPVMLRIGTLGQS